MPLIIAIKLGLPILRLSSSDMRCKTNIAVYISIPIVVKDIKEPLFCTLAIRQTID